MASTTPILPRKRLLAATVGPNKGAIRSGPAAAAVAPQPATTIPQSEFRKLSGHELGLKARRAAQSMDEADAELGAQMEQLRSAAVPSIISLAPAIAPVVEAVAAPVVEAVAAPVVEAVPAPVVEAVPAPAVEAVPAPAVEAVAAPVVEAVAAPVVEAVAAPVVEAVAATRKQPQQARPVKKIASRSIQPQVESVASAYARGVAQAFGNVAFIFENSFTIFAAIMHMLIPAAATWICSHWSASLQAEFLGGTGFETFVKMTSLFVFCGFAWTVAWSGAMMAGRKLFGIR